VSTEGEVNAGHIWTKNAIYKAMMEPGLNAMMLQIIGWVAVMIGVVLLLGRLFLRNPSLV
jgi:hypothetical protein